MESAVLSILQADDRYTVTLETSRQGPLALAGTVWVDSEHRQDVVRVVDAVTALINRQGGNPSPFRGDTSAIGQVCELSSLEDFGQLMYGLFLPPLIQNALRDLDTSLIISTNDSRIPWELLHDGQSFLGLRTAVTRRLMVTRWVAGQDAPLPDKPNVLIVANPLCDLPDADSEADELMALLDQRGVAYDLLRGRRATYIGVQQALVSGRYEIIHYTGHAFFDADHPERSGLHLADDRNLPASQIEGILRGKPLVFLNACSSARQMDAAGAWEVGYTGPQTEGLASAFVAGGAAGFLGAQWPIFDAGSRRFSTLFYQALLDGASAGDALQAARNTVRHDRPHDATWASFVFYGDPRLRMAETRDEMVAQAQACYDAGQWDDAAAVLDLAGRRGECDEVSELAATIARSKVEKERLDGLYASGMTAFERRQWHEAASALSQVVAAEADHAGAQPALIEARRQIELSDLFDKACNHAARHQWRPAMHSLLRLQNQAPDYAGATELLAHVQGRLSPPTQGIRPLVVVTLAALLFSIVTMIAAAGVWRDSARSVAAALDSAAVAAAAPSPTQIVIVYVASPDTAATPTPTLSMQWLGTDGNGSEAGIGSDSTERAAAVGITARGASDNLARQGAWTVVADPISRTLVYAGSDGGGLFRSSDGGQAWSRVADMHVASLVADAASGDIYAGGSDGVWRSSNRGVTWTSLGLEGTGVVALVVGPRTAGDTATPTLLAATSAQGVFASDDGGQTWSLLERQEQPDRQ